MEIGILGRAEVASGSRLDTYRRLLLNEAKMRITQNPLFRRSITPSYDSNTACGVVLVFTLLVAGFSLVGINVAEGDPAYRHYVWLPLLLLLLSLAVCASTLIRLVQRLQGLEGDD